MAGEAPGQTVYVVSQGNHEIVKVSPGNQQIFVPPTVEGPYGLAFDSAGILYVGSGVGSTSAITKYDSAGVG